jgi:hypothetical protein
MYKYKFGLPPIQHPNFVAHLPVIREFITTVAYCTLRLQDESFKKAEFSPTDKKSDQRI